MLAREVTGTFACRATLIGIGSAIKQQQLKIHENKNNADMMLTLQ